MSWMLERPRPRRRGTDAPDVGAAFCAATSSFGIYWGSAVAASISGSDRGEDLKVCIVMIGDAVQRAAAFGPMVLFGLALGNRSPRRRLRPGCGAVWSPERSRSFSGCARAWGCALWRSPRWRCPSYGFTRSAWWGIFIWECWRAAPRWLSCPMERWRQERLGLALNGRDAGACGACGDMRLTVARRIVCIMEFGSKEVNDEG